jgi:Bacterial Fe(2+) trafficking
MARRVHCLLLKREAEGLDYLPYPGAREFTTTSPGKRGEVTVVQKHWPGAAIDGFTGGAADRPRAEHLAHSAARCPRDQWRFCPAGPRTGAGTGMSEKPIARRVLERMRRQLRSKVANLAAFRLRSSFGPRFGGRRC